MKNLLFNSLLIFSFFFSVACANQSQKKSDVSEDDTSQVVIPDSLQPTEGDTLQPVKKTGDLDKAKGDSVKAQSTSAKSTPGTTTKTPGAIKKHGGPNQAETDSIKKAKTKILMSWTMIG